MNFSPDSPGGLIELFAHFFAILKNGTDFRSTDTRSQCVGSDRNGPDDSRLQNHAILPGLPGQAPRRSHRGSHCPDGPVWQHPEHPTSVTAVNVIGELFNFT